jgi:FAD synthase
VELVEYLRAEAKFDDVQALKTEIGNDARRAREALRAGYSRTDRGGA